MSDQDFSISVALASTPEAVYAAIVDVRGWWSEGIRGSAAVVGDSFEFEVDGVHRSTQRIVEAVPGRRMVWQVEEAWMSFVADTAEWVGTHLVFEIEPTSTGATLVVTHRGLSPQQECYDACSEAWTFYLTRSLVGLVVDGLGEPHRLEQGVKQFEQDLLDQYSAKPCRSRAGDRPRGAITRWVPP